jgi:zinc D-Ala-D-Ala carboxypeptidase
MSEYLHPDTKLSRHFKASEFACKCGCGGKKISMELVEKLEKVRVLYGLPMKITSGYRCLEHNSKVGGSPGSSHIDGEAVDIECVDSGKRDILVGFLRGQFTRMGIAQNFIHVDVSKSKVSPVLWVY